MRYILFFLSSLTIVLGNSQLAKTQDSTDSKKGGTEEVTMREGSFYELVYLTDSTYQIKWGIGGRFFTTSDTFAVLGSGTLGVKVSGKRAIVLEQSCGTSCNYCVILPLLPGSRDIVFDLPVAYDIDNDLVAFVNEGNPEILEIVVENYLTGKTFKIQEKSLCPAVLKIDCIDSCSIVNKRLFLRWEGKGWKAGHPSPKEMRIKIPL